MIFRRQAVFLRPIYYKTMADINILAPVILKWEGGYVNNPLDHGGCTNMGVTLATYQAIVNPKATCADIKAMTKADFILVLRKFWDRWLADQIHDQKLADILVDWVWGSGAWGIKIPQRLLGVAQDGMVGPKTVAALNAQNPVTFLQQVWNARKDFLCGIVERTPSQQCFLKGWLNRLNDFK